MNPSINISIGNYGEKYISSFHNYFMKNEPEFLSFSSFYKCGISKDGVFFNLLNDDSTVNKHEVIEDSKRDITLQLLKNDQNAYYLKNSIFRAYTHLVNLIKQLSTDISYQVVNINIITSTFENNTTLIINEIVSHIHELQSQGTINNISLKAFTVIARNEDILTQKEQIVTYQNFEELRTIKSSFSNVFHNIIILDNLNTKAVYLKISYDSIGFVLNEFITYLMTNQYGMIGNLQNIDFISLGLGTVFFDEKYFKLFFESKILSSLLIEEQISDDKINQFNVSGYSNLRDDILVPFLNSKIDINEILNNIKTVLDSSKNNYTLLEYRFLLSNLLGQHDDIQLKDPYTNIERISLYDVLFKLLNDFNILSGTFESIDILKHKENLDKESKIFKKIRKIKDSTAGKVCKQIKLIETEISKLEEDLKNLGKEDIIEDVNQIHLEIENKNDQIEDLLEKNGFLSKQDVCNDELENLQSSLLKVREKNKKDQELINEVISQFKNNRVKNILKKDVYAEISRNLISKQGKKSEIEEKRKSFLTRIFKKELKRELERIIKEISLLKQKDTEISDAYNVVTHESTLFFEIINETELLYTFFNSCVMQLKDKSTDANYTFHQYKMMDYLFVNNIIDIKLFDDFFNKNEQKLISSFKDTLQQIINIHQSQASKQTGKDQFNKYLSSKLFDVVNSIINFNIIEYLNGEYNDMNLFKPAVIQDIIEDLLTTSSPFFNSDISFNPNNSHALLLHNNACNQSSLNALYKELKTCFAAAVPSAINTQHTNKFSIIKIDIIDNLNKVVKYNVSKEEYNKSNANTIIQLS